MYPGLGDLVWDLGDDQRGLLGPGVGLDQDTSSHLDDAPSGHVGALDSLPAVDESSGGEVGPWQLPHDFLDGGVGVFDQEGQGVDDLADVVGRDLGGHADGDAVAAVDQQVRQPGGQEHRLLGGAVEVGGEVDGVLVDVG